MFVPLIEPADEAAHASPLGRWFVVRDGDVLAHEGIDQGADPGERWLPTRDDLGPLGDVVARAAEAPLSGEAAHYIGSWGAVPMWSIGVDKGAPAPDGFAFVPLRSLHAHIDELLWFAAGRAVQIVEWGRTHRFCGRCGQPTARIPGERAMGCDACGHHAYPRLSPAVIMVVHREDELLLARGRLFPVPMYSALAGFVEPGESLEDAVRREVREEVGVEIHEPVYFGSQPWPFPNSLMLGFHAEWAGGDIEIDPVEIVDAQWFRYDELPNVPGSMSIASKLITAQIARRHAARA